MTEVNKGGRPSGEKVRCGGRWTEARYHSFIKNLLRQGTRRWAPIQDVKKKARTRRGFYQCSGCNKEVPATVVEKGKRVNNALVDHIEPIIPPEVGFTTWDSVIERMYCEEDNLQVLCRDCHTIKTNEERALAAQRRKKEKEQEDNDA